MRFSGDIIITDPCYICKNSDWDKCGYGENMELLGIKNYIYHPTIFGDLSYMIYNSKTNEKIGDFCVDSGMAGVFLLNEVLEYNPDFDFHIKMPDMVTWIKDFDGKIHFNVTRDYVIVIGEGSIDFVGL